MSPRKRSRGSSACSAPRCPAGRCPPKRCQSFSRLPCRLWAPPPTTRQYGQVSPTLPHPLPLTYLWLSLCAALKLHNTTEQSAHRGGQRPPCAHAKRAKHTQPRFYSLRQASTSSTAQAWLSARGRARRKAGGTNRILVRGKLLT